MKMPPLQKIRRGGSPSLSQGQGGTIAAYSEARMRLRAMLRPGWWRPDAVPGGRGRGESCESRRRIRRRYHKATWEQTLAIWEDEMNSLFYLKQGKEGKSKKKQKYLFIVFFAFTSVSRHFAAASPSSSSKSDRM
jgi:hypothetical protein